MPSSELPREILCPVDFSDSSAAALRLAATVGKCVGARLTLLHAITLTVPSYFTPGRLKELEREVGESREEAGATVRQFAQRVLGPGAPPVEIMVEEGSPADVIVAIAERLGSEWIVMGTHGRSGVKKWMLGSVAERVVRTSHIPVLVVRE